MPNNLNKGFALVPILVLVSLLSVASFVGYNYYVGQKSDQPVAVAENPSEKTEEVLAATTEDISSYLLRTLFGSPNLTEFNKSSSALILNTVDNLNGCSFFTRGAKPLSTATLDIYQNVVFQSLPKNIRAAKYLVVVAKDNKKPSFVNSPISVCNENAYVFPQPAINLTVANLNTVVGPADLDNSAKVTFSYVGSSNQLKIQVIPNGDDLLTNYALANNVKFQGINVGGVNYRIITCTINGGGCEKGYELFVKPADNAIVTIPLVNNKTKYNLQTTDNVAVTVLGNNRFRIDSWGGEAKPVAVKVESASATEYKFVLTELTNFTFNQIKTAAKVTADSKTISITCGATVKDDCSFKVAKPTQTDRKLTVNLPTAIDRYKGVTGVDKPVLTGKNVVINWEPSGDLNQAVTAKLDSTSDTQYKVTLSTFNDATFERLKKSAIKPKVTLGTSVFNPALTCGVKTSEGCSFVVTKPNATTKTLKIELPSTVNKYSLTGGIGTLTGKTITVTFTAPVTTP